VDINRNFISIKLSGILSRFLRLWFGIKVVSHKALLLIVGGNI